MPVLEHERLKAPSQDDSIWRYMGLSKFKDLLETSKLYFCRLDKFDNDPMEGVVPDGNYTPEFLTPVHHLDVIIEPIGNRADFRLQTNNQIKLVPLKECYGKDYESKIAEDKKKNLSERQTMFVNCWHKNEIENEAFWRMYHDTNEPTVAIKTTVKRLKESFKTESWVYIADVQYYDENGTIPTGNGLYQVVHKRKQFEYEKEIRLIYWSELMYNKLAPPMRDSRIDVDINTLISEVWVSPKASESDLSVIKFLTNKIGLAANVKISTILKKPKL